ncbi:MAG: RDD family protein [Solirubrobacteraceae bacterium]
MIGERAEPVGYAGFVTRAVALIVDAVVIDVIALIAGGAVTLISSAFGGRVHLSLGQAVAGGVVWLLWTCVYFVVFWTLTGQTPGNRLLGIYVRTAGGETVGLMRGVRRFLGLVLAMIPFGAGFLPVLVDDRRRGLHDRIAGTVVLWGDGEVIEPPPSESELVPAPSLGARLPTT